MTVIAHISDLHLLEARLERRHRMARLRLGLLSAGRALDAAARRASALAAFRKARGVAADHVVVSGDLTEDGSMEQFEALAEVLHESGLDPECVTLVPGNHDAYGAPLAFEDALKGPLRPFAAASEPGAMVFCRGAVIAPINTAVPQNIVLSGGYIDAAAISALEAAAESARDRAVIAVQHHPPHRHSQALWRFIDGLRGQAALMRLLERDPRIHVLHGHVHRARERAVRPGAPPQVFSAPACCDDRGTIRLYDAADGRVVARGRGAERARSHTRANRNQRAESEVREAAGSSPPEWARWH